MRIVFMGTPAAAVPTLKRLVADGHEVVAVWTRADSLAGRGNKLTAPLIKECATELGLQVYQPTKIKTPEAAKLFASHEAEAAVVVAYGRILPASFLVAPKHGCINVHFSLLPKWRGAAPVNWAIIAGDTETGVTTMQMDEGLDTGSILLQRSTAINEAETAPELTARLAETGADLLSETLRDLSHIKPRAQAGEPTYAAMLTKEMGAIDWRMSATEIKRRVRGLQPSPLAHTTFNGKRLIVWRAEAIRVDEPNQQPASGFASGQISEAQGENLVVICEDGASGLRLLEVQPEGKRRMSARDFLNGAPLKTGDKLV